VRGDAVARRVAVGAAAVALAFGVTVAWTGSAEAATCSASSSGPVTGGQLVTLFCADAGFVRGYGSDLTAANREALLLHQFFVDSGARPAPSPPDPSAPCCSGLLGS
jgi:hypothetical protein